MAFRPHFTQLKNQIFTAALAFILACAFVFPSPVYAKDDPNTLPALNTFIESVNDGNAATVRGVYVSNVMALEVVQQPAGKPGYVSTKASAVTQFSAAAKMGNIGLLAHNTHAGSFFSNIKEGDLIVLVYGDGHLESFKTESILRYQALDPLNPYSQFKDLKSQKTLSAEKLFTNIYSGDYHLTLQTCIENNGNASWGRLFIVATPVIENEMAMAER